jgi:hypothetical protein
MLKEALSAARSKYAGVKRQGQRTTQRTTLIMMHPGTHTGLRGALIGLSNPCCIMIDADDTTNWANQLG